MEFVRNASRAVYGRVHTTANSFFKKDRAHYKAPCQIGNCHNIHERKCDYVISAYIKDGRREIQMCGKLMCRGCTTNYPQIGGGNSIDYCPEHDQAMLEHFKNTKR